MFDELPTESFDARERRILDFWAAHNIFEASVEQQKNSTPFVFYDGPPFATGLPHYGHLLAGTIKDVVLRYKTMRGFFVPRRFGWDCHGLPVENEVEKQHGLAGAAAIDAFGIPRFNEACRKIVLRYTEEWKASVRRMGRWVDFSRTWKTMDQPFMESVWWVFKQLFDRGLVYEGYKVMPFSAKLGTPLSNFEAGENYKEVDDPSLIVALRLTDDSIAPNAHLLIWTTTPWTLLSNQAVLVGAQHDYVAVLRHDDDKSYIVIDNRLAELFPDSTTYTVVGRFKGSDIVGKGYQPPFDYFIANESKGAFRIVADDSIATDEGTGLVHAAPAFGEVDFYACQRAGIPLVCPVDNNGQFTDEIPEYKGLFVKDADKAIARRLKEQGLLFSQGVCRHRYPFCYRSDTPLIYKAVSSWFVAVESIKDKLLAANEKIHWTPSHVKEGRFGKWLEGARDWAISRNRYWGTPIPLWRATDGSDKLLTVGSIDELHALSGATVNDLHRHYIDEITIEKDGVLYKRIPEVFDCWFESGSMPYAQNHYPFENRERFDSSFPADFIAEGMDQTRGWFYTLTILAAALFDKPAFKNVIVNGIILAADGNKMSKRLQNYPDPLDVVGKYGADAIRLYMMHSPAVRGDNLCFAEGGVELILRQILIPWWNAYSFFITYARIYAWKPSKDKASIPSPNVLDRWIVSKVQGLLDTVTRSMDDYDLSGGVEPLIAFIDALTNWYIRRSRRRFWSDEESVDRAAAFETLYRVLVTLSQIAAPYVPFLTEAIWLNLRSDAMAESVHLSLLPEEDEGARDVALEAAMDAVQTAVSLGHSLRKEHKLKVRQPLPCAYIACGERQLLSFLQQYKDIIADELNVKEVHFKEDEEEFVSLKAKPNFRVLGKKVGKQMKAVHTAIDALPQEQLSTLMSGGNVDIAVEGSSMTLTPDDVAVDRSVHEGVVAANQGAITLALETTLDDDLILEGLARELVNKINTMRREAGLAVTDRIDVAMQATEKVRTAYGLWSDYVRGEVLAESVAFVNEKPPSDSIDWNLNGEDTAIAIKRRGT